ncbi:MAG: cytochrome P450 [Deltaproteobacteria bacterium]|nr:cytochrome P450 [Deltaproteobacteria bacterium]
MTVTPLRPEIDFAYAPVPDLDEILDDFRDRGAVVPVLFHGQTTYLVTRYAAVRAAFADEESFPAAAFHRVHAEPSMGRTMLGMVGDEHRRNRLLVSSSFLPSRVARYVDGPIREEAVRLVDALEGQGDVDLVEQLARPFPFSVITRLLGLPVEDEPLFLEWALKLIDYPWDPEGALKARSEFTEYLRPLLERRRKEPEEDVLSILATTELEGQRLEDEEVFAFCRLLYAAGSDTGYKNLGSLLAAILQNPGMCELARESDTTREALVQEGLRWQAPVALQPRTCRVGRTFEGVAIPSGAPMLFGITAANHDPELFSDPHRFDPHRPNSRQHLSFGHGDHFCLGSHLARRELEAGIKYLFERFPDMELAPNAEIEFQGCVLRGPREVRVRLRPN